MNPIEYKITLDCRRAESQVTITAKQGEASGRKITFSLNEGRLPYKVPAGVTAVLRAKKPSGAVLYNTCTVTADGNVEYIITTQTVAEVGKLPCELQLSQDGKVIFSPNFTLLVYKNLSVDSEVESSDEFTALQDAINRAESLTDGTTFTPTVSEDGVLSWTNDGGKANPEPVNIKGSQGADGATFTPSVSADGTLSWTNNKGLTNPETVNIMGPQGEGGADGAFRVNVTYSDRVYSSDKTFDEIKAAYDAGQQPYVVDDTLFNSDTIYTLSLFLYDDSSAQGFADFERHLIREDTLETETLRIYSHTLASGSNIELQISEFNAPGGSVVIEGTASDDMSEVTITTPDAWTLVSEAWNSEKRPLVVLRLSDELYAYLTSVSTWTIDGQSQGMALFSLPPVRHLNSAPPYSIWLGESGGASILPIEGINGTDGIGIQSVEQTVTSTEDGGANIITVTKTDGTSSTFTVKNGSKGSTGATGATGASGADGKSAYQIAVENGFSGTEAEWLASLKGPIGETGPQGIQGIQGPQGPAGAQQTPLFANTTADCTDTTKVYVLPDGYIYAYMTKSVTHTPTNQVPNSKAADGTPYNGGQGYKDNTRLSLSAGESAQSGYTVTGFIPVEVGDTIRFKNVNTSASTNNVFVIFYDSAHNYVGYLRAAQATEVLSAGICVLDDALTLTSGTLDGTAFFRVSMLTNDQADYFFTINELTEPTIVTEEGWFSTDHAFVPADYEDRIIGLEARVDDIADDTNNAPTYVANEAKRVADVVKGKQTVGSLTFTAMSDMHIRTNDSYWADNVTSCRDAGIGLAELQKHLRLDFSALLGDYTVGGASDTVEKVKQDISIVKTFMSKGQKGIPNLWLTGNHDINYGASSDRRMTEDEMFAYITNNNNGTVQDFDNIGRNYGFIDFDNQKIRCIYLNTVDSLDYPDNVGSADDNSEVTAIQTQWLADVGLNLTGKSDAAEWGIVLFSHHCLSIFPHATTILTAYRNGESGSVNVTTNGVTTAVDYDFTTANRGEIICAIHGHDHNFTARKISNERWDLITPANAWLWSVCIPNIDTKRNNEKATDTDAAYREAFGEFDEQGNPVYYPKTQGTATSTSFCVVTIDRRNRKIHAVSYGAGHDRTFDY